jgi:hypothetical protein
MRCICRRSRKSNSYDCRCVRTNCSLAFRCMTCGRSTCLARGSGSHLINFCALRTSNFSRPRRWFKDLWSYVLFLGRIFGWDRPRTLVQSAPTFADRLTDADRTRSLTPAGVREGPDGLFRVIYQFENEKLVELINRTVHAAALSALVETANGYRFYFAVYVRNVGWLTPLYMAAIDPFRKLIIYPGLMRSVRANWDRAMSRRDL